jgi:hypothetical protein
VPKLLWPAFPQVGDPEVGKNHGDRGCDHLGDGDECHFFPFSARTGASVSDALLNGLEALGKHSVKFISVHVRRKEEKGDARAALRLRPALSLH